MHEIDVTNLRGALQGAQEIALVDTRAQEEFIRGQILASVNIPFDRLDLEAARRIPRKTTPICIIARTSQDAEASAERLRGLGYTDISMLMGGVKTWRGAGLPLFEDVNAESKAFGEFVEHEYATPNTTPEELHAQIQAGKNQTIVDCRPQHDHLFAHIPGAVNVQGGDIYSVLPNICPNQAEPIIIHCGGRTRGIIAAQGLINAGFQNPVSVLSNGTMGWHLSGFELASGESELNTSKPREELLSASRSIGLTAMTKFHISALDPYGFSELFMERTHRTLYLFDLRSSADRNGEPPLGQPVLAGQLIQATDEYIAVRGARVILIDDDRARAAMTASWLKQLGWLNTYVAEPAAVDPAAARVYTDTYVAHSASSARAPKPGVISPDQLVELMNADTAIVFDVSQSHEYLAGHIKGAVYCPRSQLANALKKESSSGRSIVIASRDEAQSMAAACDIMEEAPNVRVLKGDLHTSAQAGLEIRIGIDGLAGETSWLNSAFAEALIGREQEIKDFVDWELERFFDPSAGVSIEDAMRKYLNWEIRLIDDYRLDGCTKFERLLQ